MAISQNLLRQYATSSTSQLRKQAINEAVEKGRQTAFLSHSHQDAELAKGMQSFFQSQGWDVYIDWEDQSMPDSPNRETAKKIQDRIKRLDWFLFLATQNSMNSRWCPWEIGYADGVKTYETILIIPTLDSSGRYHGNEYLQLYRKITDAEGGGYGIFGTNQRGSLLRMTRKP